MGQAAAGVYPNAEEFTLLNFSVKDIVPFRVALEYMTAIAYNRMQSFRGSEFS
jgi:hypothetical protein